jgi:hypothetical protein
MTVQEAATVITNALQPLAGEVDGLQVYQWGDRNQTPPALDFYPDSEFQDGAGFGVASKRLRWVVRARVNNADGHAASDLLYRLLEPTDPASVEAALAEVGVIVPADGTVSGFTQSSDDPSGEMIGAVWRVAMYA